MKRCLAVFLTITLLLTLVPEAAAAERTVYSGTCGAQGSNLSWTLDTASGLLTIQGSGELAVGAFAASEFSRSQDIKNVSLPDGLTNISIQAFDHCVNLISISIPEGVTSIGCEAFSYCRSLSSVSIPESVTSIGNRAFCNCSSLSNVTLPSGISCISAGMFLNSGLKSVSIPGSVTCIEASAYYECSLLTSIALPNQLETIGTKAFTGSGITSVSIPGTVLSIGENAFALCDSLKEIIVDASNPNYSSLNGVLFDKTQSELLRYPAGKTEISYTIPNGITTIRQSAFGGCSKLNSVEMPSSLNVIEYYAFRGCSGLLSLTIPNSVTTIGFCAFGDCSSLKKVTIPNSVTSYSGAFNGCSAIEEAYLDTTTVYSFQDSAASLKTILFGEHVKQIEESGFSECKRLSRIVIPENVDSIGNWAFYECSSLSSILIENPSCEIYMNARTLGAAGLTHICADEGSTAQAYANKYGFSFGHCFEQGTCTYCGLVDPDYNPPDDPPEDPPDDPPDNPPDEPPVSTYTVQYDANGGKGAPKPQTQEEGKVLLLTHLIPVRKGYCFVGWSKYEDEDYVHYSPGQIFREGVDTTLYAVWEKAAPSAARSPVFLAAGEGHSLAFSNQGTALAFGLNFHYQLGDGTYQYRYEPVLVEDLDDLISVAAGAEHSCAIKKDGSVWTWGNNDYGQLGDGSDIDRRTPVKVVGLEQAVCVAAGSDFTIVSKEDGTVWSCGWNYYGELGVSSHGINGIYHSAVPVRVNGLYGVEALSAGEYFGLALRSDGTVWSWGRNNYGQLGIGNAIDQDSPIQITSLSGIKAIGAGSSHAAAVAEDGSVWTWGLNESGQLGIGNLNDRFIPVQVPSLTNVTSVALGADFTLALKSDGTVWSWGSNGHSALGNGQASDRSTPGKITGLKNIVAIAAGENHGLALDQSGRLWAWGGNEYGQLGIGSTTEQPVPVRLSTGFISAFPDPDTGFVDVKSASYYDTAVRWASANSITSGTSDTTFSPNDSCTRAQVVTFLWRAAGSPKPTITDNPFTDVKSGKYYYSAVLWALENGITSGTSETEFSPNTICTRAQIVTFLWRFEGSPAPTATSCPFQDVKKGAYYEKAVLWASESGVTAGTSATTFSPNATCTRAQVVTFLYRDMTVD